MTYKEGDTVIVSVAIDPKSKKKRSYKNCVAMILGTGYYNKRKYYDVFLESRSAILAIYKDDTTANAYVNSNLTKVMVEEGGVEINMDTLNAMKDAGTLPSIREK